MGTVPPRNPRLTPPSTRGLRAPSAGGLLKLRPLRPQASVDLDSERDGALPPFEPWHSFTRGFTFEQGEHVTAVGTTGSGKTTLIRELVLPRRRFVVVAGTKRRDPSLYEPLMKQGFRVTDDFDPTPAGAARHPKVIFKPELSAPTAAGKAEQREAFRTVLIDIFAVGGWAFYGDEIRYLTDYLGLQAETETLWLQGRSLGVSMIAATQRPVSVPLLAFDSATHLFLWRNTDRVNIQRMSEFAGADVDLARYTIPRLPLHEALYIDTRSGRMVRTKVELT